MRTHPDAECGSDNVPVVVDIRMMLKKPKRKKNSPKAQPSKLKDDGTKELKDELTTKKQWSRLSEALVQAANEVFPKIRE